MHKAGLGPDRSTGCGKSLAQFPGHSRLHSVLWMLARDLYHSCQSRVPGEGLAQQHGPAGAGQLALMPASAKQKAQQQAQQQA